MEPMSIGSLMKEGGAVARAFRWDQPFRLAASLLAIAAIAGASRGRLACEQLAYTVSTLGADGVAAFIDQVDEWLRVRAQSDVAAAMALVGVVAGVASAGRGKHLGWGRAASTAALSGVAGTYVWGSALPGLLLAGLTITLTAARQWRRRAQSDVLGAGEWAARCVMELVLAVALLPLTTIAWLLGGEEVESAARDDRAPTGAVSGRRVHESS